MQKENNRLKEMEKQFVSYDIALAMADLKYDEPCIAAFTTDDKELNIFAFDVTSSEMFEYGFAKKWAFKAPMWQECIDYFINKLQIWIETPMYLADYNGDLVFAYKIIIKTSMDYKEHILYTEDLVPTLAKAREKGILKAIELCKSIIN
jgi:uncharacterized protein YciU (UPF0263 family)